MRFLFKTHYNQDVRLFKHGGQVFWYGALLLALIAAPWLLPDYAIIGSAAEVQDRVAALADIGVTEFAAVEFGATADEIADTRAALQGLLT